MKVFRPGNTLLLSICILLGGFALMSQGCSSLSRVARELNPLGSGSRESSPGLKKKVGLMPLLNLTDSKEGVDVVPLESLMTEKLSAACEGSILVSARETASPSFLTDPPEKPSGAVDNLALAMKAREEGFTHIVRPVLSKVHHEKLSSWWDWVSKEEDLLMVGVRVEIFDAHSGTKTFHDNFLEEREIRAVPEKKLTVPQIMALPDFEKMTAKLAKTMAKKISGELNAFPWKGFIVSTDGKAGVLSSGSRAGIQAGQEFSLSKDKDVMTGYDHNQYIIPGPVVDTVKVVEVNENQAKVVSVSGNPVEKGAVLQVQGSSK
jgi:hypothetical protein